MSKMYCFKCGSELGKGDMCTGCGVKVRVYKQVIRLSNSYYNMGIAKAKNRDLTGACELLNRSLKLYKRNTDARNALGLVYFEMGEAVQALTQWVISKNLQPDDNAADRYMAKLQSNPQRLNTINQSLKKYNVALTYAQNGDDDIAVIQLKKILNSNPNLIKGHLLLALIYMKKGSYERAKKPINKVLRIDTNNPLAKKYLAELKKTENEPVKIVKNSASQGGIRDYEMEQINREIKNGYDIVVPEKTEKFTYSNSHIFTVINILVGALIGIAATYFLFMPAKVKSINAKHNKEIIQVDTRIESLNSDVSALQAQVDSLTAERDSLSGQLTNAGTESSQVIADFDNLLAAMNTYNAKDYVTAAQCLRKIANKERSATFTSLYQSIQPDTYAQAAKAYYNTGIGQASTANSVEEYSEAIINITEIFKYDYASVDYVNATNVLGTTYEKRYDLALTQDVNAAAAYKQQSITDMNNLITGVLSVNPSIDSKAIENLNAHIASLTAK